MFLRDASFSPVHSHNRFRRRLIKRNARKYSLYGCRLRQGSRIVLHEEKGIKTFRSFHYRKKHLRGPDVFRAVQKTYVAHLANIFCFEVVRCCAYCSGSYTHSRDSGLLLHYSVRQRKGLYRKIGIPFVWDIGLRDVPELDPLRFRQLTVDLAGPWNCFCVVISYVITGTCKNVAAIGQWVRKIRRYPHSSL